MINSKSKSQTIKSIDKNDINFIVDFKDLAKNLNTTPNLLDNFAKECEELKLIKITRFSDDSAYIELKVKASDLIYFSEFMAQKESLKLNLQKLQTETDFLKNTFPEKSEKIASILLNVATICSFYL
ncbi:hypothetical protein UJ101_00102 [Flavobacteriaceae bacterium UJ101]|nr:hypothetical protein UJ101_00102 [Flavobacteriaceae bacterium UJ101]